MKILPVPFDTKGQMLSWTAVYEGDPEIYEPIQRGEDVKINPYPHLPERCVTFKPNKPFEVTLTYAGFLRGCSSAKLKFTDGEKDYEMFLKDFDNMMVKHGGFIGNTVTGTFEYCKRGQNYGIRMVSSGLSPERCAELVKADQEGRLHIAPCPDGTTIYFADEEQAEEIMESIDGEENHFYLHGFTEYVYGEFGKDWFLTSQEAEKALEREDGQHEV